MNFFDRLAYAVYDARAIRLDEMHVFGWYLQRTLEEPELFKYAQDNGFSHVLRLACDYLRPGKFTKSDLYTKREPFVTRRIASN